MPPIRIAVPANTSFNKTCCSMFCFQFTLKYMYYSMQVYTCACKGVCVCVCVYLYLNNLEYKYIHFHFCLSLFNKTCQKFPATVPVQFYGCLLDARLLQ